MASAWVLHLAVFTLVILPVQGYGFNILRRTTFQHQAQKIENLHNLTLNCSTEAFDVNKGQNLVTAADEVPVHTTLLEGEEDGNDEHGQEDNDSLIAQSDVQLALDLSLQVIQKTNEDIVRMGWKLVHENELYTLFKRRGSDDKGNQGQGPVEYMMKGFVEDVSPRIFLHTQTNKALRKSWDNTMKDMKTDEHSPNSLDKYVVEGNDDSEDTLYYRTKWPWPLKDRDYTLARRVHFVAGQTNDRAKEALVFVSRASVSGTDVPRKDGVIRVDNYWCHSVYFSSSVGSTSKTSATAIKTEKQLRGKEKQKLKIQVHQIGADPPFSIAPIPETDDEPEHTAVKNLHHGMEMILTRPMFAIKKGVPNLASIKVRIPKLGKGTSSGTMKVLRHRGAGPMPVDLPGTRFVTIFCDDSKVPLPAKVVDMISAQAEKVVPESMRSLHKAAVAEQARMQAFSL